MTGLISSSAAWTLSNRPVGFELVGTSARPMDLLFRVLPLWVMMIGTVLTAAGSLSMTPDLLRAYRYIRPS